MSTVVQCHFPHHTTGLCFRLLPRKFVRCWCACTTSLSFLFDLKVKTSLCNTKLLPFTFFIFHTRSKFIFNLIDNNDSKVLIFWTVQGVDMLEKYIDYALYKIQMNKTWNRLVIDSWCKTVIIWLLNKTICKFHTWLLYCQNPKLKP